MPCAYAIELRVWLIAVSQQAQHHGAPYRPTGYTPKPHAQKTGGTATLHILCNGSHIASSSTTRMIHTARLPMMLHSIILLKFNHEKMQRLSSLKICLINWHANPGYKSFILLLYTSLLSCPRLEQYLHDDSNNAHVSAAGYICCCALLDPIPPSLSTSCPPNLPVELVAIA